ncbi:hypothetical protein BS78_01G252800 [Paspalum vaginatum]|nr:hypothetical protein BS78_01G252800 [Paspalum vaginatum]KAJ1295828.1 hypothetical protein BS78_01G252800 [Paspalum vaginatum]
MAAAAITAPPGILARRTRHHRFTALSALGDGLVSLPCPAPPRSAHRSSRRRRTARHPRLPCPRISPPIPESRRCPASSSPPCLPNRAPPPVNSPPRRPHCIPFHITASAERRRRRVYTPLPAACSEHHRQWSRICSHGGSGQRPWGACRAGRSVAPCPLGLGLLGRESGRTQRCWTCKLVELQRSVYYMLGTSITTSPPVPPYPPHDACAAITVQLALAWQRRPATINWSHCPRRIPCSSRRCIASSSPIYLRQLLAVITVLP